MIFSKKKFDKVANLVRKLCINLAAYEFFSELVVVVATVHVDHRQFTTHSSLLERDTRKSWRHV